MVARRRRAPNPGFVPQIVIGEMVFLPGRRGNQIGGTRTFVRNYYGMKVWTRVDTVDGEKGVWVWADPIV